jgi:integrase
MAWIEQQRRADGGVTARVIWRPGGGRDAARVWETFSAGSDAQNLARADGFKRMVDAAGQRWPDGWVKGEGFVRPADVADPLTPPPNFDEIGEEYVRQIVDLSLGQRKRYLGQLKVLAATPVRGALVFGSPITAIGDAQLKSWLVEWDRSLKTKANYHGLIHGVFAYAVKRGYLAVNPAIGTAPKQSRVKQSRPELRFLTERELETAVRLARRHGNVLAVTAGTGLRFGEIGALWVGDVDLDRGMVRVNKAWKRNGEDDATETPGWLARQQRAKHTMRDHHLGNPKTPRSRRTITIAPTVAALLNKRIDGRAADDFVFTSRTGLPLHNGHDLRHTHVAWLIAGGARFRIFRPGSVMSITTTIDTYGHLLPAGDELISRIIDTALTGGTIRPMGRRHNG